ncbi:molybdate transport system permease protein [Sulfuritortus calidifontis]|uniref:Molybdate transport system permease protein n=1 Tax=Sulfuritortus calidifontis TaxID=1914471 RepID=A0A4R3JXG3_9PROT|nr:ABC transporter permease [Sulfuritortus calidifontis]TCS73088.1 molybdate transport system permease protein [Sulfuritortus calidifontis]
MMALPVKGMRPSVVAALAVLALYAGLIVSLFWFLDPATLKETLFSERTAFSIKLSLMAATSATVLALLLAIPAAYALSRYRFPGREAAETVLEFPIIVSPAALGAILLIFFNNPLGEWLQENVVYFVFGFAGIVLAQFVTVLGLAVRMLKAAFDEVPPELETVARTLGASPRHGFFTVTLPLAKNGLIAAFILTWAKALGEFGATLMVAGSMAMRTETLPIAIFMKLSSADIEGTVALILVLVTIGLTALFVARRILGRAVYA